MNRRSFLSALSLSAAAIAVDPEMLGWTKKKSIFVPPGFIGMDIGLSPPVTSIMYYSGEGIYEVRFDDPAPVKITEAWIEDIYGAKRIESMTLAEFKKRYPDGSSRLS